MRVFKFISLFLFLFNELYGQNCSNMNLQFQSDIPTLCSEMTMTMMHDQLHRPYLYVANKEAGLKIYDITNAASPALIQTIPINLFDSLEVMNVSQDSNYMYLAVGNYFAPQKSGMAIVDVTNPSSAFVTDFWENPGPVSGSGIVKIEGNYAYLGAMQNGLIILDISNKNSISFVSQFHPDFTFPDPNPDSAKYNARGMQVKNDVVYLCMDAGGLRIINVTNKNAPIETGRYSNPLMNGLPRAYNNIVIDDTLAYVAVDYCGMEVLNISDTSNITLTGWWNPYNCPGNNWFTSPVHANEIQFNKSCSQLLISTGKSDLHVIDISNPSLPDSCNYYGGVNNSIGTWGVGIYEDEIYLSYICNPLPFPFPSNWTGVKILKYDLCTSDIEESSENIFSVYPNPADRIVNINFNKTITGNFELEILDSYFRIVNKYFFQSINQMMPLDVSKLETGIYFIKLTKKDTVQIIRIIIINKF